MAAVLLEQLQLGHIVCRAEEPRKPMPVQMLVSADPQLRGLLLDQYLAFTGAAGLADWLRGLGQDPTGPTEARKDRIRTSTKYLTMPAEAFPRQTKTYLDEFSSDQLADICLALGLDDSGSKDGRYRRILREVGYREGWLPRGLPGARVNADVDSVAAFLRWYPITKKRSYEREYCEAVFDELCDVFGSDCVYEQLPIAHATTLKIDFHVGPPQGNGVGVEVKVPTNNAETQRALVARN